jgi:hypothetical protein
MINAVTVAGGVAASHVMIDHRMPTAARQRRGFRARAAYQSTQSEHQTLLFSLKRKLPWA